MQELHPQFQNFLDGLSEEEVKAVLNRLRLFASRYFWLRYKIKGGYDLEWLIMESIEDAYFGIRAKPLSLGVHQFLCGIIRSKADHLLEKEKRGASPATDLENLSSEDLAFIGTSPTITLCENAFQSVCYTELADKLRDLVRDDVKLLDIVEAVIQEPDLKPREIASKLNIPQKEVTTAKRRLRRKLKHLRG